MDCDTGKLHYFANEVDFDKEQEKLMREQGRQLLELDEELASELEPMGTKQRKGYMRNKPCPCGSGKKFKRCCWSKYT